MHAVGPAVGNCPPWDPVGVGKRKWVPLVVGTATGPMVPSTHASQKPGGDGRGLNLLGGSEAIL